MEEKEELSLEELEEKILDAVKTRNVSVLREIFETVPSIDIAEALDDVDDVTILIYIFRVVKSEYSAEFFAELSIEQQEKIINACTDRELVELIKNSFADDIADTLEEMPANVVSRVLKACPKDMRQDVNTLLNFKENTAGSIMTTEYLEMKNTSTVKEAIKFIREKGRDAETVYTIFVRDSQRTLVGTVNLDELIFSDEDKTLEDIMDRDFVTCNADDDQEEVANMFKRYDLTAMAVVNRDNKIIGIITIDDVVDIIVEEATEDIAHLGAVSTMDEPYLKTPTFKLVLKCFPWIIVLMLLQVFSAMILSRFESAIETFAILAVFTPLIMDAGGNSGGQTTTMIVRSLSLDEFEGRDYGRVIWKELRVALIIASIICTFAFGWLMFEMSIGIINTDSIRDLSGNFYGNMALVASLVAGTLFVTVLISRLIGCSLPFLAKLLKLDPAVVCGPITTTMVDIISLITYFIIWTQVLYPIMFG